uniref:Uncharacterized protein n=1 Tax=Avena sativa TaxID=4498 RepID=A0ACD5VAI7_AVESA
MAALSDEEQDDLPSANLSAGSTKVAERVQLEASISKWAPLEKTRQQVMLKVMVASSSSAGDRLGLDLVVVLDVSGEKLANKMKNAMQFIISKLSPMDRLCIVGTTGANNRLQFMTKDARAELRGAVDGGLQLQVAGAGGGLETGLQVLAAGGWLQGGPRRTRRTASVLLMSDCKQQPRPRLVETMPNSVVVHTFGFGKDNDLTVLEKIAHKSPGGTFNFVSEEEEENLSAPISQILAGLLSVVVQDLKLIMWTERGFRDKVESTIEKVDAGSCYPHRWGSNLQPDSALGVTVSFGDLYSGEDRKVIVDLLTPAVESGYKKATLIVAQCSYSYR